MVVFYALIIVMIHLLIDQYLAMRRAEEEYRYALYTTTMPKPEPIEEPVVVVTEPESKNDTLLKQLNMGAAQFLNGVSVQDAFATDRFRKEHAQYAPDQYAMYGDLF